MQPKTSQYVVNGIILNVVFTFFMGLATFLLTVIFGVLFVQIYGLFNPHLGPKIVFVYLFSIPYIIPFAGLFAFAASFWIMKLTIKRLLKESGKLDLNKTLVYVGMVNLAWIALTALPGLLNVSLPYIFSWWSIAFMAVQLLLLEVSCYAGAKMALNKSK
ncbi:hypothetical protein GF340_01585 [Candidatus Peregrinibacteria bacterium]|nr:hypothetical protein [Candidatus Peregrinibacteria bacterium]